MAVCGPAPRIFRGRATFSSSWCPDPGVLPTFGTFLQRSFPSVLTLGLPDRRAQWGSVSPRGTRDRTRGNGLDLYQGRFKLDIWGNFFTGRAAK